MPGIFDEFLLSWVVFSPLIGAVILLLLPRARDEADPHADATPHAGNPETPDIKPGGGAATAIRGVALATSLVTFILSLMLIQRFDAARPGFQLVVGPYKWVEQFKIDFHLGI